ncbi:MAG: hypothetical protein ACI358_04515 [Candidatus Limimorpha sp.]
MRKLVLFLLLVSLYSQLAAQKMFVGLFNHSENSTADVPMLLDLRFTSDFQEDTKAMLVLASDKNQKTVYWQSFPLQHDFQLELLIPSHLMHESSLNCYVFNPNLETLSIDNVQYSFKPLPLPSFLPENITTVDSVSFLKSYPVSCFDDDADVCDFINDRLFRNESDLNNSFKEIHGLRVLYSEKEGLVALALDNGNEMTKPLSILIDDNQYFNWRLEERKTWRDSMYVSFVNENESFVTEMKMSFYNNNSLAHIGLKTRFLKEMEFSRLSLIVPFLSDDFTVYRNNMRVDENDLQNEYYLGHEGFSLQIDGNQFNIYYCPHLSSIQLDVSSATAFLNLDYEKDHPLIHFPARNDTAEFFVDRSKRCAAPDDVISNSFDVSASIAFDIPRVMPVWNGYESAIIWTEHADWTDISTHRAVCFGNESVVSADSAVGGFVYYNVPVTKSVFYNNTAGIVNFVKNKDFKGLHSTIKTDSLFFDFLLQLKEKGFDICLHTPEQYTTTHNELSAALSFMRDNFGSPTWIDHGYNNSLINNRENLVCDALNKYSPYYAYSLWKENGVRYIWNAAYEEFRDFDEWTFSSFLQRPYPFWGDAFPKPRFMRLPFDSEMLLWSTEYTIEPGESWNYYFSDSNLEQIVESRSAFIIHSYPAWVTPERGFWTVKDGLISAKDGFNTALQRIADLRDRHLMLPTTVDKYMRYQERLQNIRYVIDNLGFVTVINDNPEPVEGLTLISRSPIKAINKKYNFKTSEGEYIIWFDIQPGEKVIIR